MSTALRSAVPASFPVPTLTGVTRRLRALPSLHVGAAALIVLVGGLLLAIATTSDPLWWQLHFSQLGIFGDLSSAFFNSTLKVSGMIVVVFAFCVRRDVARLGRGPVRRGAATVACICLNVVGVNLALVGCIPLNTDKDLHDRVAGSMVLGFLALLISAPIMFNRLGKRMAISTGIATVWLVISIALFVTATINLALFETISCTAMFAWSGMFTHVLASGAAKATVRTEGAPVRHLVPRRVRRRTVVAPRAQRRAPAAAAPHAPPPHAPPACPTAGLLMADTGAVSQPLLTPQRAGARLTGMARTASTWSSHTAAPARGDTVGAGGPASGSFCSDARPIDRAGSPHIAGRTRRALALASSMRSTAATRPGGRAHAISASRAVRVDSADDRRRRPSRPVRRSSAPAAGGAARSLPR